MSIYASFVDDNDPSIIYSGSGWGLVTEDGDWRGTMHSTSVTGSWARFRFTGSRVVVICTIPTGSGALSTASFQIDDGPVVHIAHRTTPAVQWQAPFWNSGPLPFGSHLLTITNLDDDAYFRMDRIDFDPTDGNAPRLASVSGPISPPPQISAADSNSQTQSISSINPTAGGPQPPTPSTPSTGPGGFSRIFTTTTTVPASDISLSTQQTSIFSPGIATSISPPAPTTGPGSNSNSNRNSHSLPATTASVLGAVSVLVLAAIGYVIYRCVQRRRRRIRLLYSEGFDGPRMALRGTGGGVMPRPVSFSETGYSLNQSAGSASLSEFESQSQSQSQSESHLVPYTRQTTILGPTPDTSPVWRKALAW